MELSPTEREELKGRYGYRCAYCGNLLGLKWHADHVKPVRRTMSGRMTLPARHRADNLMPACVPCNIHKSDFNLESWRKWLEDSADRLTRNYSAFRHASRFGLIEVKRTKVVFWFEQYQPPRKRNPWPLKGATT
jgi:hypothetical protein